MKRQRPLAPLAAAAIAGALLAGAAHAQLDLLDLGNKLLKGDEQQTAPAAGGIGGLSTQEIASGLKEALRVGSGRVVGQLGRKDGFAADPAVHIPLPDSMRQVQGLLANFGMGGVMDDLELKLNRAAEAATPRARQLFMDAISQMTLDDARRIYNGPSDAATRYFESKMSPQLAAEMRPVVDQSLSEVGAVAAYDGLVGELASNPLVPDVKANLTDHVLQHGLDGIFHYLAQEEAAIRSQPVARTTDLLKRVFGN